MKNAKPRRRSGKLWVESLASRTDMSASVPERPASNGYAVARDLHPKLLPVSALKPLGRETRKHPPAQVRKLADSLDRFGFVLPILIDGENRVVAGWGLVLAARKLGIPNAPTVTVSDLDEADLRLLRLALNRLGEESSWDVDALKLEFADVLEISNDIDLEVSGFEMGEIDVVLGGATDEEDALPIVNDLDPPLTKVDDLWRLGDHRLLCADALKAESYERLMGPERAQMIFTDPPWNIAIEDNVSGLGAVKHKDFAMACGEMTPTEFEAFLRAPLSHAAAHSEDGALQYICMHWSKMKELLAAAEGVYDDLVNLCVWNKTNAGMGSLYRSKHELVFVYRKGKSRHVNNVALGRFGRHRSNVWDYPGQNIFNGTDKSKLRLHPTAKPVALVADAIRDASRRGGIILDAFGGAGSTLIAAEKTGRKARLIELEPRYVDVTVKRWETLTGRRAEREPAVSTSASGEPSRADAPAHSMVERESVGPSSTVLSSGEEGRHD
jgi:DNA modification methylase